MEIFVELIILAIVFYKFRASKKFNGWAFVISLFIILLLGQASLTVASINIFAIIFLLNYLRLPRKENTNKNIGSKNPTGGTTKERNS